MSSGVSARQSDRPLAMSVRSALALLVLPFVLTGPADAQTSDAGCKAKAHFVNGDWTLETARARFRNVTYRTYSFSHGNQIEHATAEGRIYLWYPGNTMILPGRIEIVTLSLGPFCDPYPYRQIMLCFSYGENTYNPVTGHRGSGRECRGFSSLVKTYAEFLPGDPLGLARMKTPPFPLPRNDQSIAAVKAQMGR